MDKQIIGAVGVGNATFTAGQEAEFEAAVKAAHANKTGNVDFDALESAGVIRGFGKATAEAAQTMNRQRKADGSRADEAAAEADAEAADASEAPAPKAAKKPRKR